MKKRMHYSAKEMQRIANLYMESGEPWPATTRQMAAWAINNGLWKPKPASLIEQCAELLSQAMRQECIVDRQGRTVRAKQLHATSEMVSRSSYGLTFEPPAAPT